ncbi:hypothetical protein WJX84_004344 [Apatococcus fuscideae]|uniref:Uncharacterized protein n=1 Tax=Apatococcus fuscideae TaxID=2026836 RepID=A0AAW1SS76_9CHLO
MNIGRKRRFLPEELSSIDAITRAVKRLHTSSPSVSSLAESTQAQSSGSMHAQSGLQETSMTQEADSMGALALEVDQPAVETQSRPPRHRNDSPLPPSPCGSLSRHLASRAARWRSQNRLRRHEVDMAQVAIARLVGRQQMGDEDAAASARLELLNALDDLDMGPQPAASSTPSRLPRRLNLPRNSSVTFIPNPLTQFPSGPASPFSPLAPSSSGGQPPRPLTHSMSGLAAADIKRPSSGHYPLPHSALDRLPGLPERRQSLRRVPQHEGAEEPELMTAARQKGFGEDCSAGSSRFFRASGTDPGRSKGDAARVVDQSGGPQMPGTPDRICSEDGSPAQPQAEGGVEGSGRAYDTVYEEANHLLRNLHFERIRRTKRSWQWDL